MVTMQVEYLINHPNSGAISTLARHIDEEVMYLKLEDPQVYLLKRIVMSIISKRYLKQL